MNGVLTHPGHHEELQGQDGNPHGQGGHAVGHGHA